MEWIMAAKEFGLVGGILLVVMMSIVVMSIKGWMWILEQFKHELNNNRAERKEYLDILHKMGAGIDEYNARSKEFMVGCSQNQKEMIITLGRINGFKKE